MVLACSYSITVVAYSIGYYSIRRVLIDFSMFLGCSLAYAGPYKVPEHVPQHSEQKQENSLRYNCCCFNPTDKL